MKVTVVDGDIATIKADAIITAINSGGMWFGGMDGVIIRAAGKQFHDQAANALYADSTLKTIVARRKSWHKGAFANVVFVVDDLNDPLDVIVGRGLAAASAAAFTTVSLPLIRFGVMKDVSGTVDSKLTDIATAVSRQGQDPANKVSELAIVVYGDLAVSSQLRAKLGIN